MTEFVLPAQTNLLGKLLGGHVMHLVHMAAAMAAHRHSNSYVVTASVDYIDFRNPVNLGEIVILKSQVNRVFHTSLEVGVEVYSENVLTGKKKSTGSMKRESGARCDWHCVTASERLEDRRRQDQAICSCASFATVNACSTHAPIAGPRR